MLRRMVNLAPVLLLGISTVSFGAADFKRAQQMLHDLLQEGRGIAGNAQRPKLSPDDYSRRLLAIQSEVNRGIAAVLNANPHPPAEELQAELRNTLGSGKDDPYVAAAVWFPQASGKVYVVAYQLLGGIASSRSWVGVFGSSNGGRGWRLEAAVDNSLPNKTIALQPLNYPGQRGITFLAYGINWGDAHNRLTVLAYSFDGGKLQSVWSRADLPNGEVKAEGGSIELKFLNSMLGPGYKSVRRVSEVYRVTPAGVILLKHSEAPRE